MDSEDFIAVRSASDLVIETEQSEVKEDFIDLRSSEQSEVKLDFNDFRLSNDIVHESGQNEVNNSTTNPCEANTQGSSSPLKEELDNGESSGQGKEENDSIDREDGQLVQTMDLDNDSVPELPILHEGFNLGDRKKEAKKMNGGSSGVNNGITIRNHEADEIPISGVKRARMTYVDQDPSVHVVYISLPSASKRKLEELLQQWSQWHGQQKFSTNDPNEALEFGEQTFFPAMHFGLEKASSVSFWMDNQTRKEQNKFVPLEGDSVPMYDRGFALGLTSDDGPTNLERGLEAVEASRCFNCGSYSHALKDCRRPRDNSAVDNARKQHNSKRIQPAGPRNSPRYYQNTPGGKYDSIRPGVLSSETRQLLGLGELDPPPWLHKMREIGYPPGYLDPDYEDQPSGITIFADEETSKEGEEDGEILDTNNHEPKKKMTVEFPGINAPIPENADERRWASLPEASSFDLSRNRLHSTPYRSSETIDRGNYSDPRRSRDYRDDGPPGVDSPRYSGYVPNFATDSYSSRGHPTPILGRSVSDRGRWSPLGQGGSPSNSSYSPVAFASQNTLLSPQSYNSANSESWAYGSHHKSSSDSSSRKNDRHDHHHHRRR